jgi:hypothetical protein
MLKEFVHGPIIGFSHPNIANGGEVWGHWGATPTGTVASNMYLSHFNLIRISLAAKERECAFNDKSMKFSTNVDLLILNDFRYIYLFI